MKKVSLYALVVCLLLACSKEKHRKWETSERIFFPGVALTVVHTDNYNSDMEPFDTVASTVHQVYIEEHILPEGGFRSSDYTNNLKRRFPIRLHPFGTKMKKYTLS